MGNKKKSNKKTVTKANDESKTNINANKELEEYKDFARKINTVISNIANGNLSVKVEGAYSGEMQSIQNNVNSTVGVLQNLLDEAKMHKEN